MKLLSTVLLSMSLLLFCCQSGWGQRRADIPKCGDKCKKCKEKLNPYQNGCQMSISLKGIEFQRITEEEIHCCEYRIRWHCMSTYAQNICTEDESKEMTRFADYDVYNVVGNDCYDVRFGEWFCRNRSSPMTETSFLVNTITTTAVVIVWLAFELKFQLN